MYVDSGQPVINITGEVRVATDVMTVRGRRSSRPLILGLAKIPMISVEAVFAGALPGTRFDPGDFQYVSGNQYLRMENSTEASGITLDPADVYSIPIEYLPHPGVNLSTLHVQPESLE